MAEPKYFGVVVAAECYHQSPNCPYVRKGKYSQYAHSIIGYKDADEAFRAGHLRPCERCEKDHVVKDEENGYMRLTVEQLATLKAISSIKSRTGKTMTLAAIADVRKKRATTIHAIIKILEKGRLVRRKYDITGAKAKSGSIDITAAGKRTIAAFTVKKVPA